MISLALNLGLAAIAGFSRKESVDRPLSSQVGAGQLPEPSAAANAVASAMAERVDRLRDQGASEANVRLVIAGIARLHIRQPVAQAPYWSREWQSASGAAALAAQEARDQMAAEIARLFGPEAESFPEFSEFFRPLDGLYPFLTPTEQRVVARRRAQRQVELSSAAGGPSRADPLRFPGSPGTPVSVSQFTRTDDYADVLSANSALELALRESALASQLRAAETVFTEQQFRDIFVAIRDAEARRSELDMVALSKRVPGIQLVAGLASHNAALRLMGQIAERHGVGVEPLLAAFGIYLSTSFRISALAGPESRRLSPGDIGAFRDALSGRDTRLRELLGPVAAEEFRVQIGASVHQTGASRDGIVFASPLDWKPAGP